MEQRQLEEYQRRAHEADREELRATDRKAKLAWERIAVGYLELADLAGQTTKP